jgi:hypothetical protein
MPEPKTRGALEQTAFFRAGAEAKKAGRDLAQAIHCLRPGCWQYDAFIEGYDAPPKATERAAGTLGSATAFNALQASNLA